jgi:HEAT repeat protein
VFASSQSLPDGVQEMVGQAKREGGQLRAKLQRGLSGLDLGEIEEYELFRTSPGQLRRRVTETATGEVTAARTPRSVPPPAKTSSSPLPRTSVPANTSVRPISSLSSTPMPDRDAYDQLVKEFKEADSPEIKKRVAERLEKDQKSDNSLIRYYAVRAMSKLDSETFSHALESATQDEDATVRAVAMKALNRAV